MSDPAPTILTVTLNSALDKVILVDELTLDRPNTAQKVIYSVGGKGLDTSVVLRGLGVETTGLVFLAGRTGRELSRLVKSYGIHLKVVWVEGETRWMDVIAEVQNGRVTHIREGRLVIQAEHMRRFVQAYRALLKGSSWVVLSGSIPDCLPVSTYAELVRLASACGAPSLVDASQEAAKAVLACSPTILKMNQREFSETFGVLTGDVRDLMPIAAQVKEQNAIKNLVITCAEEGVLAFTEAGDFWAVSPPQRAVNPAGAGDAVSAAIAWRLSLGEGWESALRWAAATAAAVLLTEGTAECNMEDVRRIFPGVTVRKL